MDASGTSASEGATEILQPFELADLLGIDRGEVAYLTTAGVRVTKGWPANWRTRRGPLELTAAEAAMLTGRALKTIYNWCGGHGKPAVLAARKAGPRDYRISPAALVACLKQMAGPAPVVVETPTQRARRASADKAEAAALCGTGRRKPRAA